MDKDGFIGELYQYFAVHDWGDIDGGDLQDMMVKHGLLIERPVTEEECREEWATEWGLEPDDNWYFCSDEMRELLGDSQ